MKLPADSSSVTLGIISLSILLLGFCCGPIAIVALTLAIIGLVKANRSIALYHSKPEEYNVLSYKNVKTGKILNIIAIPLSGLVTLFWLIYYFFYGAAILSMFSLLSNAMEYEQLEQDNKLNEYIEEIDDTIQFEEEPFLYEKDSISLDSVYENQINQ